MRVALVVAYRIREAAKTHKVVEQELAHAVNASVMVLSEAFPSKPSSPEVCFFRLHYPESPLINIAAFKVPRETCFFHVNSWMFTE